MSEKIKIYIKNPTAYNRDAFTPEEQQVLELITPDCKRTLAFLGILSRGVKLFDDIYLSTYGRYSLLISLRCGGVFRFRNDKYQLITLNKKLVLQEIKNPANQMVVYNNKTFYPSKGNWLMQSCQRSGNDGKYKCFTLYANGDFEKIIIRDHHLQALFKFGVIALTALAEIKIPNCVNHLNGKKLDNFSDNLEITTYSGNTIHYHKYLKEYPLIITIDGEAVLNPKFIVSQDEYED